MNKNENNFLKVSVFSRNECFISLLINKTKKNILFTNISSYTSDIHLHEPSSFVFVQVSISKWLDKETFICIFHKKQLVAHNIIIIRISGFSNGKCWGEKKKFWWNSFWAANIELEYKFAKKIHISLLRDFFSIISHLTENWIKQWKL